jgi:protoporphyrinogen/coproporphyrinogen III oxidase
VIEAGPDSVLAQKPAALELCEALGLGAAHRDPRAADGVRAARRPAVPPALPVCAGHPDHRRGIAATTCSRGRRACAWPASRSSAAGRLATNRWRVLPPAVRRGDRGPHRAAAARRDSRGGCRAPVDAVALSALRRSRGALRERPAHVPPSARPPGRVVPIARRRHGGTRARDRRAAAGWGAAIRDRGARLDRTADGWTVTAGADRFEARAVILAVPAPRPARCWSLSIRAAAALCREVPYVSTASVALAWRRDEVPHPLDGSGFVVARNRSGLRITACTWVSSKWDGRAPEGDVLLRAFIGGAHDPDAVTMPTASSWRSRVGTCRRARHARPAAVRTRASLDRRRRPAHRRPDGAASPRSRRASCAIPACSSPAAGSDPSGFPTASRTAGRRARRPPRLLPWLLHLR